MSPVPASLKRILESSEAFSVRDVFAMAALTSVANAHHTPEKIADAAYAIADAMVAKRAQS